MAKRKGGSRRSAIVILCITLALTVFLGIIGTQGMKLDSRGLYRLMGWMPTTNAEKWPESLALGLDLRGGVYVEYSAKLPESSTVDFETAMNGTITAIQRRLDDQGYNEATVQRIGADGLRVEIPDVENPSQVLELIGTPAKLEFRDSDGSTFMTGDMVASAAYQLDSSSTSDPHQVAFTLTGEGAKLFADMTAASIGKTISIYLDGELLIAPTVNTAITEGRGVITGGFSEDSAKMVASQIQSGALPLDLTQQKVDTVSATLGDNALSTSVFAAMIGIALVMLFLIWRYRVNGIVASWALVIYTIALFWLIAIFRVQLTLPGLAGVVLGIGMAVDANVVIYERFNEELRAGRRARLALKTGFKNALAAILDSNVTTIIAAVVLLFYGTGSIQGFAKTLLLGVVVSMFSAILITRMLMTCFVNLGITDPKFFMGRKAVKAEVKDHSKICLRVSAAIIVVALILTVCGLGVNLGIDFAGGLSMQYDMGGDFAQSDIEEILNGMNAGTFTVTKQGGSGVIIRVKSISEDDVQNFEAQFEERLTAKYPAFTRSGDVSYVGPVAGETLLRNAFLSVLIASACMLIYIAFRFDLNSGLAAVFGLLHDVAIMWAFMVLLRGVLQMNSSYIAAMLTIVGYSINNTIIIFDRIRENKRKMFTAARADVVKRSVSECLGRTVGTSVTTLLTIITLFVLGVDSIRQFALPIIIGIVSGIYSSNLVNGYVWAWLEQRKLGKKAAKA